LCNGTLLRKNVILICSAQAAAETQVHAFISVRACFAVINVAYAHVVSIITRELYAVGNRGVSWEHYDVIVATTALRINVTYDFNSRR